MKQSEFNLALASQLQPVFSKSAYAAAINSKLDSRTLFYHSLHISEQHGVKPQLYCFLKQRFQLVNEYCAANLQVKFTSASLANLIKTAPVPHSHDLPETTLSDCLVHCAPIYFTELGWLAGVSQTATNQSPLAIDLMAMYLSLTDGKQGIAQSREVYRAHLLSCGIELPALHTLTFAKQTQIGDEIFDFAAIQQALTQFPRVFLPEILGFTLAYCQSDSLPVRLYADAVDIKLPDFVVSRKEKRHQAVSHITTVIKTYLGELEPQDDDLWRRIQLGFWLYQQQLEHCEHKISTQLHTTLSPRQSVEKLLALLRPKAIGHHGKIRLGSRTLDDWFKETPFKSVNFLASLLHSPYVDRAKPEHSKLLTLFEFGGPMFGVMDDDGRAILKNWLLSELNPALIQGKKHRPVNYKVGLKSITSASVTHVSSTQLLQDYNDVTQPNYSKLSNRELYYYLVNSDIYPEALPAAKETVNRVLIRAKCFNRLPFRYSHQAFEAHIQSIYQHEVARYKLLSKKPKLSKSTYVWGIEQFAPTILTDGSWLQDISQLDYYPDHAIGALLHKIYQDEMGNGVLAQNHPHIYQILLDDLAIKLPPIDTKEFTSHPGFINSAFDIPVYLMAIAKFPNAFLPELLGLNMAIELSGLGNVYLRLSEELKFWGIDSAIVDVHTSIDNLATGHAALAIKAIQIYLDDTAVCHGENVMQAHWRRIYTGYCSLQTASKRFKYSLIWQYFAYKRRADNKSGE